jgi:hypothetical protein
MHEERFLLGRKKRLRYYCFHDVHLLFSFSSPETLQERIRKLETRSLVGAYEASGGKVCDWKLLASIFIFSIDRN